MPVSTSNVAELELVPGTDGAVLRSEGGEVGKWDWWAWKWKPSHAPGWPTPMACCTSLNLEIAQQIADDLGDGLERVWRLTIWQREKEYTEWHKDTHVGSTKTLELDS